MALYVILKSANAATKQQNFIERHVPFHTGAMPTLVNEEIDYVQADGDELDVILDTFVNLPHTKRLVQRWYGDMAKFIYYNLW